MKPIFLFFFFFITSNLFSQDAIEYIGSPVICAGGNIELTANNAKSSDKIEWYKDGTKIPGESSTTYTATVAGTYSVKVNNQDYPDLIITASNLSVNFIFNNDNTCASTSIQFNGTASGGKAPHSYAWSFGGGGNSSSQNPSHQFNKLGCGTSSLNNTLTITDANGCKASKTLPINVKELPDVGIADQDVFNPFSNCQNSPSVSNPNYTLTIKNASPDASCISTYDINWGDGNIQTGLTSSAFPLTHTYTKLGAFVLQVTGKGSNGCTNSKKYTVANQTNPAGGLGTLGSTTGLCAPADVPFVISNWQLNSPGTSYIIDYGDGESETLTHPLNGTNADHTIHHIYKKSSCPNPSFTATLSVVNACDITPYTAGNIQVRIKPIADFTLSPNPACVNQNACFTNKTILGSYGPTCNTTTVYSWDFGDPSSSSNTSSLENPCHIYTTPGSYNVTLTTTNPCGSSTKTMTICVTAPVTPSFTLDKATGCMPLIVNTTNTTTTPTCGTTTYNWSVAYIATNCGTTADWSFAGGTGASSQNASFSFVKPGTYKITLSITNACGTYSSNKDVIVKSPPSISLAPMSSGCAPLAVNPTAMVTNCGTGTLTYAWTFAGGLPASSSNVTPGNIAFTTAGIYTASLAITNECGTTTVTQNVTVNTITTANAGPAQNKCGSSITMAANAPITGNGSWQRISGPNFPTINAPTSPTSTITGLIPGTYVFRWTISNGTCSSSSDVTITIASGPTAADAGIDQNLCLATSATLSGNAPSVGTGSWTYVSGPPGCSITDASLRNTTVTGLVPGIYIFRWTINFSNCAPSTDDVQITISDNPTPSNAGPDQTICANSTNLVANMPSVGVGQWTKVSGAGGIISSPNNPSTIVTGLNAGIYIFRWTITSGNCGVSTSDVKINVTGTAATAAAGPDQTACAVNSIMLAGNSPLPGTGVWTYVSGPAGYNISNPSSPTSSVTGLVPGVYIFKWTISNGICSSTSDDVQVTINENVTVANAGPDQNKCGTSITMAANTPGVGTGSWTYVSGPSGYNIVSANLPATNITGLVPGSYVFKWTITNGSCSSSSNVSIKIESGPTIANAGTDQNLCLATSATLSGNAPSVGTGSWTYVSGPPGCSITDASLRNTTVTGLVPGIYILRWTINFSNCTPSNDDVIITVYDNPTVSNAGDNQTICAASATLNGNIPSSGTGIWSMEKGPGSAIISNINSPSTAIANLVPGTYEFKWKISNGTCAASESKTQVIVSDVATTANAGTDEIYCETNTINLKANTPTNGAGVWLLVSGPNTPNINVASSPVSAVAGLQPGVYIFKWTISNNICPASTDDVQITILKALQNKLDNIPQTICSGQSATIIGQTPTGGNGNYIYQWQQSTNNINFIDIALGDQPNITVSPTQTTWYRRYVRSLPCEGASDTIKIEVLAGISNNVIGQSHSICINTAANIIAGQTPSGGGGNYKFSWEKSIDNGINWQPINGEVSNNYNPGILSTTTWFRRLVATQLCDVPQGAASNVVEITVNPDATALFDPLKTLDCAPFAITPTIINQTTYADRNGGFAWYANNSLLANGGFPGYIISTPGDSVLIKLVAASKFGCLNDSMQRWFYSPVNPQPKFVLSDTVGCGPLSVNINNQTSNANLYSFIWDFGNGQTSTLVNPGTITFVSNPLYTDTTYKVTLKTTGGCDTISYTQYIRVKSKPKALFTPDIVEGCSPLKVNFTHTSRGTNASYEWDFGDGSSRQPAINPAIQHTFNTGVKDTFFVKLYARNDCGSDTQQYAIVVNPNRIRLDFAINGNQKNTCIPDTILFINNTTGANRFEWDFGDGSPKLTTLKGIDSVYHTYTQTGNFVVTLFGTNGCSDTTTTETIIAQAKPSVSFTALPKSVCFGDAIAFTNTSDTGLAWKWDFGDGTTSNLPNPSRTYLLAGNFQVSLTGIKAYPQGFSCPATAVTTVSVNRPDGQLRYTGGYVCPPGRLHLEVLSNSTDHYIFYFGNGDSLVTSNSAIDYTYPKPGVYLPSVLLEKGGCSRLLTGIDTVRIEQLRAGFSYQAILSCGSTRINFTDTSVTYFPITKWEWNFGDGTASAQRSPVKVFTVSGTYNVQLRTTSSSGCISTITIPLNVEVRSIPVSQINNSQLACTANPILFTSHINSADSIAAINWSFGNGSTAFGSPVSFSYANTGQYTVTLISRTAFGCADTVRKVLSIQQSPTVTGSADVRFCLGQSAQLSATGAQTYQWSPVQGLSCTNCANPIANPTVSTRYKVTGINSIGCPATDSIEVEVIQPFQMSVTPNDTLCIGQSSQLFASGAASYKWNPSVGLNGANIPNPIAKPSSTTTYTVVGFDNYNCFTDTARVVVAVGQYPVVRFPAGDTLVAGTAVQLKPSLTNGPFKNYNWEPASLLSCLNCPDPVATINNKITYRLTATNIYGCSGWDTVTYHVVCSKDDQVYIPNAFSPDGDGINDVFMMHGKGIKVDYFRVFNRWGQLVFDGGSNYLPNLPQYGWDGKVNGKPATQDVYVYAVQVRCSAGGTFTYKGNVSLLLLR